MTSDGKSTICNKSLSLSLRSSFFAVICLDGFHLAPAVRSALVSCSTAGCKSPILFAGVTNTRPCTRCFLQQSQPLRYADAKRLGASSLWPVTGGMHELRMDTWPVGNALGMRLHVTCRSTYAAGQQGTVRIPLRKKKYFDSIPLSSFKIPNPQSQACETEVHSSTDSVLHHRANTNGFPLLQKVSLLRPPFQHTARGIQGILQINNNCTTKTFALLTPKFSLHPFHTHTTHTAVPKRELTTVTLDRLQLVHDDVHHASNVHASSPSLDLHPNQAKTSATMCFPVLL